MPDVPRYRRREHGRSQFTKWNMFVTALSALTPNVRRVPTHGESAKLKVCVVGDEGVGKTSLIRQFVLSQFDDRYLRTVGVVVHKRVVVVPVERATYPAVITVWDLIGRDDFAGRYREAYFTNSSGVLAVCDLTRPETLDGLGRWLDIVRGVVADVPIIVLANKRDLTDHERLAEDDLFAFCELYRVPFVETSAKTGENVELAFGKLAEMGMRDALARRTTPSVPAPEAYRVA